MLCVGHELIPLVVIEIAIGEYVDDARNRISMIIVELLPLGVDLTFYRQ